MDRGAWRATVYGGAKSGHDRETEHVHVHARTHTHIHRHTHTAEKFLVETNIVLTGNSSYFIVCFTLNP